MTILGTVGLMDFDFGCFLTLGPEEVHYEVDGDTRAQYVTDVPGLYSELDRFDNKVPLFFDTPEDPYQDFIFPSFVFRQASMTPAFDRQPFAAGVVARAPAKDAVQITLPDGRIGYTKYETQLRGDPYDIQYDLTIYGRLRQEMILKLRQNDDITHSQTRSVVDLICERTLDMYNRGLHKEILTVDNHADGVYLFLRAQKQDPMRAGKILSLLKMNGGNNSGIRIGAVDDQGNVHPDQFWWHYRIGNVQDRKFGEIWSDTSEPLLQGLRNRKKLLKGRCGHCQYLDICNGNLRVRAEAVFGDVWAEDPACYLSDEEIGLIS